MTGVIFDRDPLGRRRAVFGAGGGAVDRTQQNHAKLRAGYEFGEALEIEGFTAVWDHDARTENRTFMRDAAGAPVWSGRVTAGGATFDVPAAAFAPSARAERHAHWGATLRTRRPAGWNGSLVYSHYAIREDSARQADNPDPVAAAGGSGSIAQRDGTQWRTLEAQGAYTPDFRGGAHAIALGYHRNEYRLANPTYEASDWRGGQGALTQDVFGRTKLEGVYLQDAWRLGERWSLTLGVRYEEWAAFDGRQRADAQSVSYPDRSLSATSPKAALAYDASADLRVRLSAGRGVRFPTVAELFQGTATARSIIVNDPRLDAERSDSLELAVERAFGAGRLRASVFQDDVRDSIFSQTNISVTPSVTNVQNIDRVRSRGAEAALDVVVPGVDGLSVSANLAYVRSRILKNDNNVTYVGSAWPRVPRRRGSLHAAWRPRESWLMSAAVRYSGRAYNRLQNDDVNPDVYGGASRFTIFDARAAYTTRSGVEIAVGVDNIADERAYQSHPYPARTGYLEARWSLGGEL